MSHQVCTRCIIDSTVPEAGFDQNGVCSYCRLQDLMEKEFPLGEQGQKKWESIVKKIKAAGKGKKFDCVSGLSGGRDSTYTLHLLVKKYGLRPMAVHFNDGFGNPTAGLNMKRACDTLGVELRTITSDWRESKDLKITFLKSSTPDLEAGTDLGLVAALYGAAAKENVKYIVVGHSFRTEGISPLEWSFLDGKYLRKVHEQFGTHPLRPWRPDDPGFNLELRHMFYYHVIRGMKVVAPLYNLEYVRSEVENIIVPELGWENTGAHYYDDLYQSLMHYVYKEKFNIDRRLFNWSALIRSGQMDREEALVRIREPYALENNDIIRLCIKRLGLSREEFDQLLALPPKTFRDYPTTYSLIKKLRLPIWLLTTVGFLPKSVYFKYFKMG